MQPIAFDAKPVERAIAGADAEAAQGLFLHDDLIGQQPVGLNLLGRLDAHRAEHAQPGQPLAGPLDIVGIIFGALDQSGLAHDEGRAHVLCALDRYGTDGRVRARINHYGNFERAAGMVGNHIARSDLRLGIAELAPGFDEALFGLGDDRGASDLTGHEPYFRGRFDPIGLQNRHGRAIGDAQGAEDELGAGIDHNPDLAGFGQAGVGRDRSGLAAIDQYRDRAAIIAQIVERAGHAGIIATRLGKKSGHAGRWLIAIAPEIGRSAQGGIQIAFHAGLESQIIGARIANNRFGVVGFRAEELDAEQLESKRRAGYERCGHTKGDQAMALAGFHGWYAIHTIHSAQLERRAAGPVAPI